MTRGQVAWENKLPTDRRDYLRSLVTDVEVPYADIAAEFSVAVKNISQYAVRAGIGRQRHTGTRVASNVLSAIEQQLQEAVRKEAELKRTIADLQARRLELQIRFEAEDGDVLLYGVGTEPFRAAAVDWLRWLNAEGARKLREFIATKGGAR